MPAEPTRILLTGASGMIGQQVLARLPGAAEIVCVSSATPAAPAGAVSWLRTDLRDPAACRALVEYVRPTHLVHAAWNTEHGAFWSAADNRDWLEAGKSLAEAFARNGGRRLVVCGTCAEYSGTSDLPRREQDAIDEPATLYGQSKLALFRVVRDIAAKHRLSFAWARIFNVYGIGENPARFVPGMIMALLRGEPARCLAGAQVRDFIDVRDLGSAIASLTTSEVQGPINLGSGRSVSLSEIATLLGSIIGQPDLVEVGALPGRAGEAATLVPDLTRMRDELGFVPGHDLESGLRDAVAWWRERLPTKREAQVEPAPRAPVRDAGAIMGGSTIAR